MRSGDPRPHPLNTSHDILRYAEGDHLWKHAATARRKHLDTGAPLDHEREAERSRPNYTAMHNASLYNWAWRRHRDAFAAYVETRFAETDQPITGEAIAEILRVTGGQPHDTQELCYLPFAMCSFAPGLSGAQARWRGGPSRSSPAVRRCPLGGGKRFSLVR